MSKMNPHSPAPLWFPTPEPNALDVSEAVFSAIPNDDWKRFLAAVQAHSDHLSALMRRDPEVLRSFFEDGPKLTVQNALAPVRDLPAKTPEKDALRILREMKRAVALSVGLADISGLWTLDQITEALSDAADVALEAALRVVVKSDFGIEGEPGVPMPGIVVLGLGKLGARALNYSSDIDLIVLYDAKRLTESGVVREDRMRQDLVRATRNVMRMMDARTSDGYVFRTDLRLRPDPSVTPLAAEVTGAIGYYESVGQNWERAAMIKARSVAGDQALGERFLEAIRPFIWRRHLDFAAISDIHSIKRQIHAHRGGAEIAVAGHNIKTGRGGIREIEFYAQTQQLIWGGREVALRVQRTRTALDALAARGHASQEAVADLKQAYEFLRTLEHRLQMQADQQTQTLPDLPDALEKLARFMGFKEREAFEEVVRETLSTVTRHYGSLFEDAPDLGSEGSLVFTGTEDDPDTLETLSQLGFKSPSPLIERVRAWHRGRYRALRSERARQLLTELMPHLLRGLGRTANPDEAFMRFDDFLSGLPSGVQLLSLFLANTKLLERVCDVLGDAPRLAQWLSRKPLLIDSMLQEDFYDPLEGRAEITAEDEYLQDLLGQARDYQDVLDFTRRWTNDRMFQVGMQLFTGKADGAEIGPVLSTLAETSLGMVLTACEEDFKSGHGGLGDAGLAVVAFGKLGGFELLPRSDLDLVFVYDAAEAPVQSDGEKAIGPQVYFMRLCQRLVTAIATETGEGRLYDVDTRLRPAGNKGPLATQLEGFQNYYRLPDGEAWTWEHMALTRARTIYGRPSAREKIDATIRRALLQKRDPVKVRTDVAKMRERIFQSYPGKASFDVKHRPGGLVDIEFIAQSLQLIHGHDNPGVFDTNTDRALAKLVEAHCLDDTVGGELRAALALWKRVQAIVRLTGLDGAFDPETASVGHCAAIVRATRTKSLEALQEEMVERGQQCRDHFNTLVGSFT